jgi:hypothetical protein
MVRCCWNKFGLEVRMECLAGIFEWSILLGFFVGIDLVEKVRII